MNQYQNQGAREKETGRQQLVSQTEELRSEIEVQMADDIQQLLSRTNGDYDLNSPLIMMPMRSEYQHPDMHHFQIIQENDPNSVGVRSHHNVLSAMGSMKTTARRDNFSQDSQFADKDVVASESGDASSSLKASYIAVKVPALDMDHLAHSQQLRQIEGTISGI